VTAADDAAAAQEVMSKHSTEWVGVTSDDVFLGWVHADDLPVDAPLGSAPLSMPAAQITPGSTLRNAMQIIMTSHTSVAVIDDGGKFGGVVTLEQIRASLETDR
jgi:CBS domain containing-hemolysin-like protein